MEDYKTYTLEELSIGKGSYGIAASAVPFNASLYTYLRITDINDDGTLNKSGLMSVDEDDAEKYLLKPYDIVFARTGNSTGRSYFYDGSDGELVYAGFLIKFSLDSTKVNPRILKYYTHSKPYYDWVQSFGTGSTRGNINAKTYANMPITLPSRDMQDKIVDVLKSLDDKIAVNNQINDNLEQQAQALFKSWFVDFEPFRDQPFVESELGMIPQGWKVIQLIDIAEISKNSINPQKQPQTIFNHYSIPAFDEGMNPEIQLGEDIKSNKFVITNKITLFSKLNPRIKRVWYVDKLYSNSICSTEFVPYKAKDESQSSFLYSLINSQGFYDYVMSMVNGATGSHQRFHPEESLNYNIAFNYEYVSKYCEVMSPIIYQMLDNREESRRLAELRDTLLPRLMSGEIKVGDVTL